MDKNKLTELLSIFKYARKKLISDFVNEEPNIFIPMFKYEDNDLLMGFSIEDYFISWINHHFVLYDRYSDRSSPNYHLFINKMELLLSQYIEQKNKLIDDSDIIITLLKDKRKILKNILIMSDKSEVNYNKLLHSYEKDKALFERRIKSLKEDR